MRVWQVLHVVDELVPQGTNRIPYDDFLAAALLVFFGIKTLQVRVTGTHQRWPQTVLRCVGLMRIGWLQCFAEYVHTAAGMHALHTAPCTYHACTYAHA